MKYLILSVLAFAAIHSNAKITSKTINVEVTEAGFLPGTIDVDSGTEVTLLVTRRTDQTCSTEIQVPSKGIKKITLPLNKPVSIPLGKLEKGEIRFGCGMNMMLSGIIIIR